MQRFARSRSFDRNNVRSRSLQNRNETAIHQHAIHQYRARTTFPFAATFFCARQSCFESQHIEQPFHGVNVQHLLFPIEHEGNPSLGLPVARIAHRPPPTLLSCGGAATPFGFNVSIMSSGNRGMELKETPSASSTAFTMAGAGPSM